MARGGGSIRLYRFPFSFLLLSTRMRPRWILSAKKSFTEHPARPEDAQAQAHAQEDAQAQEDAHEDAQEEAQEEWCEDPDDERVRATGTLMTLTRI